MGIVCAWGGDVVVAVDVKEVGGNGSVVEEDDAGRVASVRDGISLRESRAIVGESSEARGDEPVGWGMVTRSVVGGY